MKNDSITLVCELCPRETGVVLKLGELRKKIPALSNVEGTHYQHGICEVCSKELEEGCTFFIDESGRCMKVTLEATKEKIDPAYWGKVVKIPKSCMAEIMKVWSKDTLKLDPDLLQSSNGDVTSAGA